jgi:hypothetical protein
MRKNSKDFSAINPGKKDKFKGSKKIKKIRAVLGPPLKSKRKVRFIIGLKYGVFQYTKKWSTDLRTLSFRNGSLTAY